MFANQRRVFFGLALDFSDEDLAELPLEEELDELDLSVVDGAE
jgi:hypothetical protein